MAGKCKEMSKIKQVIRLYKDWMSKRAIGSVSSTVSMLT